MKQESKVWESELVKIEQTVDNKIQSILIISYDALDQNKKSIFLDITYFFKGIDKNRVKRILDGCGFHAKSGLSHLRDFSLITISYFPYSKMEMHDLLEQIPQDIVYE